MHTPLFVTTPLFITILPFLPIVILWTLFWKGLALWHAGRRAQAWWFVVILIVNTMGLLEIVYLFAILHLQLNDLFSKKVG